MKIGILFSGQGAQYPGMIKDLYESESAAREIFDIADCALGRDISKICFEASQEELNMTHNTQPCMLAGDLASAMVLKHHGIMADAVAGFSLGEYAAMVVAGALSFEEALPFIKTRGQVFYEAQQLSKLKISALELPADMLLLRTITVRFRQWSQGQHQVLMKPVNLPILKDYGASNCQSVRHFTVRSWNQQPGSLKRSLRE